MTRSCRTIQLTDIGGTDRRFRVDSSVEQEVLRQLTDPRMPRERLSEGTFVWVDVAVAPGAAILLRRGGPTGGDEPSAVATHLDLEALGTDPHDSGVVWLRSDAEVWLRCCGAGIDACLAYNSRCCSLALEHLLDPDELLPIPPLAPAYAPRPTAGRRVVLAGEPWDVLHCSGLVLVPGQLWSLWSDARGAPRSWELHQGGESVVRSVRALRYAREQQTGHVTLDGLEVDLQFPLAEPMEALCRPLAFGNRLLER